MVAPQAAQAAGPELPQVFVHDGKHCSDHSGSATARNPDTPWCTLARAVRAAPASSTVVVRGGRYPAQSLVRAGGGRIRFIAAPHQHVVLQSVNLGGHGVRLEGFEIPGGVNIQAAASRISVVGNHTTNLNIQWGASHVLVAANRIAQSARLRSINGINFNSTNVHPAISDVTIRDNHIGPIPGGGDAIQAKHTRGLTIQRNIIAHLSRPPASGAHPDAFQSIYGARHLKIVDNFIHNISAQGIFVQDFKGANSVVTARDNVIVRVAKPWVAFGLNASHAKIANNTIDGVLRARGPSLRLLANVVGSLLLPAPGRRERYNLAGSFSSKPGTHSVKGEPRFRNAARDDFRLRRGSPGSHAGPGGHDIGSRTANWSHRKLHRR